MNLISSGEVNIDVPQESFLGADNFGKRCLEIGKVADAFMRNGRKEITGGISSDLVEGTSHPFDEILLSLVVAHKDFLARADNLADIYQKYPDDKELYKMLFGRLPEYPVEAGRLAGGLFIWCAETDYEDAFVSKSNNPALAALRAAQSAGVSFGEVDLEELETTIPLALVRYEFIRQETFWDDTVPKEAFKLDDIEALTIDYYEDKTRHTAIIIPRAQDEQIGQVLRVIDVIEEEERETTQHYTLDNKVIFRAGSYWVTAFNNDMTVHLYRPLGPEGGKVEVVYAEEFAFKNSLDQAQKETKHPILIHELQHLLNSLYYPTRQKDKKIMKKPLTETQDMVSTIAQSVIKNSLGLDIRDEFLARLTEARHSVEGIGLKLIHEVENNGIMYNFVPAQGPIITDLLQKQPDFSKSQAQITYEVMAEITGNYRDHVRRVERAVHKFERSNPTIGRRELVAILAVHPFQTWPTVLRAVNRYLENNPTAQPVGKVLSQQDGVTITSFNLWGEKPALAE